MNRNFYPNFTVNGVGMSMLLGENCRKLMDMELVWFSWASGVRASKSVTDHYRDIQNGRNKLISLSKLVFSLHAVATTLVTLIQVFRCGFCQIPLSTIILILCVLWLLKVHCSFWILLDLWSCLFRLSRTFPKFIWKMPRNLLKDGALVRFYWILWVEC